MADGEGNEKKSENRPVGFRPFEEIPADELWLELKTFSQWRKKIRGKNEKR